MVGSGNQQEQGNKQVSVLKTARRQCYQARDQYYSCIDAQGLEFSVQDSSVKNVEACRKYRKAFESLCMPSWVDHFDKAKQAENTLYRTLASSIQVSKNSARGDLQGKSQR